MITSVSFVLAVNYFHELMVYNDRKCEDIRNFAVCRFLLFSYEIKWSLQKIKKF